MALHIYGSARDETRSRPYQDVPPILQGEDPFARDDDGHDAERVEFARKLWHDQDLLLRDRDRQIEQHIRLLAGQHWSVWNETLGTFVDVTRYMTDEERRWRFLPVLNHTLHWFMLLHARMTENPPTISWQPASGDNVDAELAEVMDSIWKVLWAEAGMLERVDQLMAWLIPGGVTYMKSRIDSLSGIAREWEGPALLGVQGPGGELVPGIERFAQNAPFGSDGNPVAQFGFDGQMQQTGDAFVDYEGSIQVDVLSPFEGRGEWGPRPWDQKAYHMHRTLLTTEQVFEAFDVEVDPTLTGQEAEDTAEFQRLIMGSGFFGAGAGQPFLDSSYGPMNRDLVEVIEVWERPSRREGFERHPGSPGGRLLIVAGDKRIRDGNRPADFKYTSPIRSFSFINMPGRPNGSSPEEILVGPQKTYNRVNAQIMQHGTLQSNPDKIIDLASGIQPGQVTNRPGQIIEAYLEGYQGDPVRYATPPNMPTDVWRILQHLRNEFKDLGNVTGSEGAPPTKDSSGELVKELRFNADRFVGPTLRRAVVEFGRMAEDWKAMIPLIWDEEKIIRVPGDDFMATTITVMPSLFEQGSANVVPELESMLPEGRGERQARVLQHYESGLYGLPGSPPAIERYFELSRFPHMGRETRPGGVDRVTAEQFSAQMLRGTPARDLPIFEWYDHQVFLMVIEKVMKRPEYLKLGPAVQNEFFIFRQGLMMAIAVRLQDVAALEAAAKGAAVMAAADALPAELAESLDAEQSPDGVAPGPPDRGPTATAVPA